MAGVITIVVLYSRCRSGGAPVESVEAKGTMAEDEEAAAGALPLGALRAAVTRWASMTAGSYKRVGGVTLTAEVASAMEASRAKLHNEKLMQLQIARQQQEQHQRSLQAQAQQQAHAVGVPGLGK